MVKRLLLCSLVILLLAIPVLTACSTTTTSSSTTTSTSNTTTTATTASTTAAAKRTSINIADNGTLTTMNPAMSMTGGGDAAANNIWEKLINFDKDNKLVSQLAESWSYSSDYLTLTVKLKKGIVFSTGDPLTAADVKWSIEQYAALPGGATAAQLSQNFSGVTVVDDYTVAFNFPAINVQFLPQTVTGMSIISKSEYDKTTPDAFALACSGTGPYKLVDYKEGQYVNLTYNDKYRGDKPQITDIHFVYTADAATRISQLQAGEVDMIQDVSGSSVAMLEKAGYTIYSVVEAHAIALLIDCLNPDAPWSTLEVRQAIDYAIDKDALNTSLFNDVYMEGVWESSWELGYDASLDPSYEYDLAKAKELMAAAGYANGFEMDLYYPTTYSWAKDMVDYLSSTLSQIGITIKPQPISDMGVMFNTITKFHNDPTLTGGMILQSTGWPGNPEAVINLTNGFYPLKDNCLFVDDQLTALIGQALETMDDTARDAIVRQAYQRLDALLPAIPIFINVTVYACDSDIVWTRTINYGGNPAANVFDLTYK